MILQLLLALLKAQRYKKTFSVRGRNNLIIKMKVGKYGKGIVKIYLEAGIRKTKIKNSILNTKP